MGSFSLLSSGAAHAADDSFAERRTNVEHAEEDVLLREREAAVYRRQEALRADTTSSGSDGSASFSRKGRVVFPELAGVSSYSFLGVPSFIGVGGIGASGVLSYGVSSSDFRTSRLTTSTLSFNPAADVFVTDHWTIGFSAAASRFESISSLSDPTLGAAPLRQTGYGLSASPRVGRAFDLGPVTLWPKIAVGYGVARAEQSAGTFSPGGRSIARTITSRLALDAVLPLSRHVIFDFGPSLGIATTSVASNQSLGIGDSDNVFFGVQAHLGITLP